MSDSRDGNRGIGLFEAVFLVLFALKLAGAGEVAGWSWWWVAAPLWVPLALRAAAAALGSRGVADLLEAIRRRVRR